MLYVINRYREQTTDPAPAVEILREIEAASRLTATALCNNSHLCDETTADTVRESLEFANNVSNATGLPIKFTVAREEIASELSDIDNLFTVKRMVLPPW